MDIEHKAFSTSVEASDVGEIQALVSVFNNVDLANERVMPGAFKNSLARKLPKMCWAHKWDTPIGKCLEARETDAGLVVKAKFNLDTQTGREAFSNIKFFGVGEQEFSIGYKVIKDSIEEKTGVRELHELELYEFSPVLVGANSETALLSVKNIDLPNEPDTLVNQVGNWLAFGKQLANRFFGIYDLRAKDGRVLSATNRKMISTCVESIRAMQAVGDELEALLRMTEPKAADIEVRQAIADFHLLNMSLMK